VSGVSGSGAGGHPRPTHFMVCAVVLALLGSRYEARVVEAVAAAAAVPVGAGCGGTVVARLASSGLFAAER
jgi:hypothetical protein